MDVCIDQPREDSLSPQVNDLRAGGRGDVPALDLADAFAGDENRHAGLGLIGETVD
jgi:hypothetical protein